jgi:hypothetical protein
LCARKGSIGESGNWRAIDKRRGLFALHLKVNLISVPDLRKLEIEKGHSMISRRTAILAFTAGALFAGGIPALAQSNNVSLIKRFDTDNDGTVDLAEAKKAASELFDKLDRDHDGTLDGRELARRLTAKELAAADLDHDGTLTKDEFLSVVEQRFKAADRDHDGTLDAKEFRSKDGLALARLLK